jgi:predicted dehydrogenase
MSDKVKVGFIGSGGIAGAHLQGLAKFEDVELAGFCDVVTERAENRAKEFGGRAFSDPSQMFDAVTLDAVFICLPPFAHGEAELACVEHGVPFFVEKPVTLSLETGRKIAAAVKEKNLLTCVGYMNRYRYSINRAKQILSEDPAIVVHGGWIGGSPRSRPGQPISWWIQKDKSGGQLTEQTTHTVDIVRYLCGEVVEVFAYATKAFNTGVTGYTIEDASMVNIKFQSGAIANLYSACACNVGGGVSLTIWARNHLLTFTGWEHSAKFVSPNQETTEIKGEGDIFAVEDRCFINAVKTGDRSMIRSDYEDGLKTAALTIAATESMETGKPVAI